MDDVAPTQSELDARLRIVLDGIHELLSNDTSIIFMTHRGINALAEMGRCACEIGRISNSRIADADALSQEIEKLKPTLAFLKARFLLSCEPSLINNASPSEIVFAEKMIEKIDSIAGAAGMEIVVQEGNDLKGKYSQASYRNR